MKSKYLLILFTLILFSCKEYTGALETKKHDGFSIDVPDYMKVCDDLAEDALAGYCNRYRNVYVIVSKEAKTESFQEFRNKGVQRLKTFIEKGSELQKIENTNTIETHLYGKIEDQSIFYYHLAINGKESHLQVCAWTRSPKRVETYKEDLLQIIRSVKEF